MAGLMDGLWRRGLLSWETGLAVVLALHLAFLVQVWLSCAELPMESLPGADGYRGGYLGLVSGCSAPAVGALPAAFAWALGGGMGLALAALAFWFGLVGCGLIVRSGVRFMREFRWKNLGFWGLGVFLFGEGWSVMFFLLWGVLVAGW